MGNKYEQNAGRKDTRKRKHSFDSTPDPSDKDYYLDDDYEKFQDWKYGKTNQAAAILELANSSESVLERPGSRTSYENNMETAKSRPASKGAKSGSKGQVIIGDGEKKQKQRVPEKSAAVSRSEAQARKKRKIKRIILMVVLEIFTLAGIFAYAYVARLMGSIQRPDDFSKDKVRNEEMSPIQKQHMTGYRTIAIFGLDTREGTIYNGRNSDLIMICNINRDTGEIRLVSVYRDTYMSIGEGTYNKINAAYNNGGAQQALAALNRDLDLDITEYVTFNWKAVAMGINMLDGVDIDITKPEFQQINGYITETVKETGIGSVHLKSPGMNHLDGVQAVSYARLRKMDTDFQRTERQRIIIAKILEKAKKADLGLLNRILLMEVEQIESNLTFSDFTDLMLDINKYHIGQTGGFPFTHGEMKVGKKGDCVVPQSLESNVSELHRLLFDKEDYEPSDMVKKISAKIAADTGNYKQGAKAETTAGKKSDTKKTTEISKTEKYTETEESSSQGSSASPADKTGNPSDSLESSTEETRETRPGETKPGESKPGETKPGETKPGEPKPGETKPGETKPRETKPGETKPGEKKTSPELPEMTAAANEPGPGQTTAAPVTTAPQTAPAGPGEPVDTTASHSLAPPPIGNSEIPVVSAPPTTN